MGYASPAAARAVPPPVVVEQPSPAPPLPRVVVAPPPVVVAPRAMEPFLEPPVDAWWVPPSIVVPPKPPCPEAMVTGLSLWPVEGLAVRAGPDLRGLPDAGGSVQRSAAVRVQSAGQLV